MSSSNFSFSEDAKVGAEKRFPDGSVDFFLPSDFTLDCATVALNDELAKGSYGTVYRATVGGSQYAVKIEDFSDGIEEQVNLLVELTMLQCFPHERMVQFHGAGCLTKSTGGAKVRRAFPHTRLPMV
jgi:hypothetical protein